MTGSTYRIAPPGFTDEQWKTFDGEGIIFIEDALDSEVIETLTAAIDRVCQVSPKYQQGQTFGSNNIVERDPAFASLIDHSRHVGAPSWLRRPSRRCSHSVSGSSTSRQRVSPK